MLTPLALGRVGRGPRCLPASRPAAHPLGSADPAGRRHRYDSHRPKCAAPAAQLRLFPEHSRRDLAAANQALARLRAAFGDHAVGRLRLRDAHLPEARFTWEPLDHILLPHPREVGVRPLVRRVYTPPVPLAPPPRNLRPDGWVMGSLAYGPVTRLVEAELIAGGWWQREVRRDYYYAETQRGDVLWVFYDRQRRQWVCQGRIE